MLYKLYGQAITVIQSRLMPVEGVELHICSVQYSILKNFGQVTPLLELWTLKN